MVLDVGNRLESVSRVKHPLINTQIMIPLSRQHSERNLVLLETNGGCSQSCKVLPWDRSMQARSLIATLVA